MHGVNDKYVCVCHSVCMDTYANRVPVCEVVFHHDLPNGVILWEYIIVVANYL